MSTSSVTRTRGIPARPNLEFDRKAAKALLAAWQFGETAALERAAALHPRGVAGFTPRLADAQLVIAREYGFASWPQWKIFVETRALDRARQAGIALRASCSSDLARARTLLAADPGLAQEDPWLATATGEVDTVRRVLERDPAWAARAGGVLGWEPVLYLCFSRWLRADPARGPQMVALLELLLAHGANPDAYFLEDPNDAGTRQSALYGAAGIANNAELTRRLLEAGADVNEGFAAPDPADPGKSPWGTEALYHASEFRETECLRLLLAGGKMHPIRVSYCLCRALDFDNAAAVRLYLEAGADVNLRVPHLGNGNHLHFAILRKCSAPVVEMLLEAGGDVSLQNAAGLTPLRMAVRYGRADLEPLFLARGAVAEEVTTEDRLLGRAMRGESVAAGQIAEFPPHLLSEAARTNDVAAIHALLDAGANISAALPSDNFPPLHQAAWRGQLAAVQVLVERGADVLQRNGYGAHALGTAIHGSENCFDVVGGPGMKLPEEAHPGQYAEIVEYLINHGAPLPENIWGGSVAVRELLRRLGVPDPE